MKKYLMKRVLNKFGYDVVLYNIFNTSFNKNVLINYITYPFLHPDFEPIHQNLEQAKVIAEVFKSYGYNVDVIDYRSERISLKHHYEAVFDICVKTPPVYFSNIDKNTKRIIYLTGSESKFANNAEMERINDVLERRGVALSPRRQAPLIDPEIEKYDFAIMIGNEYNFATYKDYHLLNYALVPNTGYDFNFSFDKTQKKSTSFIFLGSTGAVHKGLDLLLEIFSEIGEPYKLYVCGNYEKENDFVKEYNLELFHTKNIIPVGFIDVRGKEFKDICEECAFTILPSCSEGCAGSIATCMSAGVIPICSKMCGYDEDEVITLEDCRKDTIKNKIMEVGKMKAEGIFQLSQKSLFLIKNKYNINSFRRKMGEALGEVLNEK